MGCSPSKGQLFSKKTLPTAPQELLSNTTSEESAETEIQDNTINIQGKRSSVGDVVCDATLKVVEGDGPEEDVDVVQKGGSQDGQTAQGGLLGKSKKGTEEIKTKRKQGKQRKLRKQRLRETSYVQSKAEFILKAQHRACAYLNPSISKYESLLELLDQASQTRLSLRSTVASVILHYEEINQALEEMAAEGEQMLWEHGHYMTWPSSLKDCPLTISKPNNDLNTSEVPSEMLRQMLLHSTLKMISVGDSVRCLGDSALQELADYFGSLSELVEEKLRAKHAAESRLKQVLTRVEAAALGKGSPEDSALHSEDSGIGADNECQNGTERLRRHRNSSGSNVGTISVCTTEIEEVNSRYEQMTDKMREAICSSSEADPLNRDGLQINDQVNKNVRRNTRRPKTADNSCQVKRKSRHLRGPKHSQSTGCLCANVEGSDLNEQQRTPRNKQTLQEFLTSKDFPGEPRGRIRTKIRRHSSGGQNAVRYYGLQYGSKGPFTATPPNSPPEFTPEPPGRHAVKRLINTFSQGVEGNSRLDQRPSRVKSNKKSCLPLLLNSRGALTTNSSTRPPEPRLSDRPEHVDLESLPPPPPEMLMDNSFERSTGLPPQEWTQWSQCRQQRASLPRETVAPNRVNMQQGYISYSDTRPLRQDALVGSCIEQDYNKLIELDSEREAAATCNQQKAVHKSGLANGRTCRSPPPQGCNDHQKFVPPTTPPVSRARLSPSCPTVHHAVPTPPSTGLPPSGNWTPSTTPTPSSIHRWAVTEENDPSVSSSQLFSEARSIFCQNNQLVPHTGTPSCTSTLPRPWGESAKRRIPTAHLQPTFMRCSPSGHRSSHSEQQQSLFNVKQQHIQGNDVTIDGTNKVSILSEDNRSDRGGTDQEPYTAHLNTHSVLEGEEIIDKLDGLLFLGNISKSRTQC
ncbi:hypothetical protein IRJ41_023729 [Triplophysa rosa]|uniref:Photoreceptor cilium actin regulator n=1 Tax=Triplophysa rosa TaxID=992332 RepID=A0A9W7WIA2_TRIRA|nr:hypothetical protein IRJ41_023729 [Triplophysa rosa]